MHGTNSPGSVPWKVALQDIWWQRSKAHPVVMVALHVLAWLYRCASGLHRLTGRRSAAQARAKEPRRVPVIVVGNWVVGGAGKTPTTLAVLAHLKLRGWHPGVVSRGYGRSTDDCSWVDPHRSDADQVGDEPLLIARRANVPVMVGHDRRRALQELLAKDPQVDIVVSDDGLQHHRLWRDVEIVVVDERGMGNGYCLPAGPMREPVPRRLRPQTLLLYSSGEASLDLAGHVARRRLASMEGLEDWRRGVPVAPAGGWEALAGRRAFAAAGIAVPQRFFDALRARGIELAGSYSMPDHADWTDAPWPSDAGDAIVTEKDAVKITGDHWLSGPTRIWVAALDLDLPDSFKIALDAQLQALVSTER